MEVLPEGLVLDVVPAHTYADAQPTAGQKFNIGRLPCDQCRLSLGKHEHTGGEANSLSDRSQIRKHHERIVERVVLRVWAGELRRSTFVDGAEHMVVREEVVKAQGLHRSAYE